MILRERIDKAWGDAKEFNNAESNKDNDNNNSDGSNDIFSFFGNVRFFHNNSLSL